MSYGTWWVEFTADNFDGFADEIIFDMETQDTVSDYFWYETEIKGDRAVINITQSSDAVFSDSEDMLEAALSRLWSVHKCHISGRVLVDSDTGTQYRGEWDNTKGKLEWAEGIDPAEWTVEQLIKIQEFARSLVPEEEEK